MSRASLAHEQLVSEALNSGWRKNQWRAGLLEFLGQYGGLPRWTTMTDEEKGEWEEWERDHGTVDNLRRFNSRQIEALGMPKISRNPDAWRVSVEDGSSGWGYEVVVLEFLEITVTHPLPQDKIRDYSRLWWFFDASDALHFRVYGQEVLYRVGGFSALPPRVIMGGENTLEYDYASLVPSREI